MHLKLTKGNWDNLKFVVSRKQKDYQHLDKDDVGIFIYGYPFDYSTDSWITADGVYQLYSENELSFIHDIEGIYTIVILDKTKEKCFVIADRYGVYSMFYSRTHNHIILSDVISEIVPHMSGIRLNQESIIEYLNFGFKLGNKTHIEDIYEVESAIVYEISSDLEMTGEIYWEFQGKSAEDKMTKEEFLKIFNAHMATAMRLSEKVCLPLTGGLDTRTILSACLSEKERLHCYTHGTKDNSDVKIAQTICRDLGIQHSCYELNEEWIATIPFMAEVNAEMLNGLVSSIDSVHVEESYMKEEGKGELFISGVLGNEIWRCIIGNKVVKATNLDDIASITIRHLAAMDPNTVGICYRDEDTINLLRESVKKELLKSKNKEDPVALAEAFTFRNYCSNWASNSLKASGKHFKMVPAFLHRDLTPQIPLLSLAEKTSGYIQKYIIIRNNPYLASLPLDTGRTVTNDFSVKLKGDIIFLFRAFRIVMNMLSQKIFKADIIKFPYFTDYPGWFRSYHRKYVLDVLSYNTIATKDFFKRQELEKLVNAFLDGDSSLLRFMAGLLSLEIWLRKVLAR